MGKYRSTSNAVLFLSQLRISSSKVGVYIKLKTIIKTPSFHCIYSDEVCFPVLLLCQIQVHLKSSKKIKLYKFLIITKGYMAASVKNPRSELVFTGLQQCIFPFITRSSCLNQFWKVTNIGSERNGNLSASVDISFKENRRFDSHLAPT